LKCLNSAKGFQGNPSFFSWISLVFLGFVWTELAASLCLPDRIGRTDPFPLSNERGSP
jgi:hypothetical protein